jgi:hypothetical protein
LSLGIFYGVPALNEFANLGMQAGAVGLSAARGACLYPSRGHAQLSIFSIKQKTPHVSMKGFLKKGSGTSAQRDCTATKNKKPLMFP